MVVNFPALQYEDFTTDINLSETDMLRTNYKDLGHLQLLKSLAQMARVERSTFDEREMKLCDSINYNFDKSGSL